MKLIVCALALFLRPLQAQVTGNVTARVFEIRVPGGTATSFFVDVEKQEYLITANHVVERLGKQARIDLLYDRKWLPLDVIILHGESGCNDVAVLIPRQKERFLATTVDPLPPMSGFVLGQEIYFLGFPYGLAMQLDKVHMTVPLIKHGYISALVACSDLDATLPSDENFLLLDGFNNIGFFGGPVVTRDTSDPNRLFKVIAIIHGFRSDNTPVSVNGQRAPNASVERSKRYYGPDGVLGVIGLGPEHATRD